MGTTSDILQTDEPTVANEPRRTVRSLVSGSITHVHPAYTLREAAKVMRDDDIGLAVVSDGNEVVGVISERDIVAAVGDGSDVDVATVHQVETDDLLWVAETTPIDEAAEVMLQRNVRHLLIGDSVDDLAGIVSMRDIVNALLD